MFLAPEQNYETFRPSSLSGSRSGWQQNEQVIPGIILSRHFPRCFLSRWESTTGSLHSYTRKQPPGGHQEALLSCQTTLFRSVFTGDGANLLDSDKQETDLAYKVIYFTHGSNMMKMMMMDQDLGAEIHTNQNVFETHKLKQSILLKERESGLQNLHLNSWTSIAS